MNKKILLIQLLGIAAFLVGSLVAQAVGGGAPNHAYLPASDAEIAAIFAEGPVVGCVAAKTTSRRR